MQIELQVKGHRSILHALEALVEGERLEGDNQYQLDEEQGGDAGARKVDAQKRVCLGELPSTLIIQLKRFQLDFETMSNIKLKEMVMWWHQNFSPGALLCTISCSPCS